MDKDQLAERRAAIGNRIRELRLGAGYTSYRTFANEHGMSSKGYWKVESGENFTVNTILKIVEIHKITLKEFFEGVEF